MQLDQPIHQTAMTPGLQTRNFHFYKFSLFIHNCTTENERKLMKIYEMKD